MHKYLIKKTAIILILVLTGIGKALAQQPSKPTPADYDKLARTMDSLVRVLQGAKRAKAKPYNEVVTKDMLTVKGLFTVHKNKTANQWLFEIPDSLIGRDILAVTRAAKMPAGSKIFGGDKLDSRIIRFEIGPDSLIEMINVVSQPVAREGSAIARAVNNNSENPIISAFTVLAYGPGHKSVVIDATPLVNDKESFIHKIRDNTPLEREFAKTLSDFRLIYMHVYPQNIEIRMQKQALASSKSNVAKIVGTEDKVTFETVTSFVALPALPLKPRYKDLRVGFNAVDKLFFSDEDQEVKQQGIISRWRLEPRSADLSKWRNGDLVSPQKPIVIYIDPATPKQWQPYFIAGINDWQKAFEKAGFKNAIVGKVWPENDSRIKMDDARFSILHYDPSENAYAKYAYLADPRSGEIVQADINWSHQLQEQLRKEYMIQAGVNDANARHSKFNDQLMGMLMQSEVSRQVGFILGLKENLAASSFTPVAGLRSQTYLAKNGYTVSIMDQARFNYVAQPQDHIKPKQLIAHIGDYDRWAISWGYGPSKSGNPDKERVELFKATTSRLAKDPRLMWLDTTGNIAARLDPRGQENDLGNDFTQAGTYGINNLKRMLPNLITWNYVAGGDLSKLNSAYDETINQYMRCLNPAVAWIKGDYYNRKSDGQTGAVFSEVSKARKVQAITFLDKELFTTPVWLANPLVTNKLALPQFPNAVSNAQKIILDELLTADVLKTLHAENVSFGNRTLTPGQYLASLHQAIWKDVTSGNNNIDTYRRGIQNEYLSRLNLILNPANLSSGFTFHFIGEKKSEVKPADPLDVEIDALIRADATLLQTEIKRAMKKVRDKATSEHLQNMDARITRMFKAKRKLLSDSKA